jgi:hypothetical protein
MRRTRANLWRLAILALAGALLPACGKGIRVSPMLLLEGFNGTFPGTTWTLPAGAASVQLDTGNGSPAPSLKMSTTTAATSASTDTTSSFNNPSLTVSVQVAILSTTPALEGTATISILDTAPAVIASAAWNNATGQVTLTITGQPPVVVTSPAADGSFHRVVFNVTSGGVGTWTIDNGAALVTQAVAPGLLTVRLGATFGAGTSWPEIFYDNVSVSSP